MSRIGQAVRSGFDWAMVRSQVSRHGAPIGTSVALPHLTRCKSLDEFRAFMMSAANREAEMRAFEQSLVGAETFTVRGRCVVCDLDVDFRVDHDNCSTGEDGRRIPNWRERLECPHCLLNNRMRAAVGFLLAAAKPQDVIYVTEAVTPLFRALAAKHPRTIGSEYLRDGTPPGRTNAAAIRHEDVTHLTFADRSLDVIGTFDVLEHVPDYRQALRELRRCLRPGGRLFLTVPLSLWSADTVIRATVSASGAITHLTTPEYHGDPMSPDGALCFYHHGWDLMDAMTKAGFDEVGLSLFWDAALGYLGGHQVMVTARRPS